MANTTNDPASGDPLVVSHFLVQVGNLATGFFLEVSGLGSETEVTEHKIMGENNSDMVRKVPGRSKWNDIVLKRGITANMEFYNWRKTVEDGNVDAARANMTIAMLDQAGGVIAEWTVEAAFPSKISGPSLKSDSSDIGVEELTIVHEGIERTK